MQFPTTSRQAGTGENAPTETQPESETSKVVKLAPRRAGDWIESFLAFTSRINSPEIFRTWCAISALAGALQRRVWLSSQQGVLYPNLYVLLVAPPAVGKTEAIRRVADIWRATENLHVAPDAVSRASLVDVLARSNVKLNVLNPRTGRHDFKVYHGLNVAADEFGVLCPAHDTDFLSHLTALFDNRSVFQEEKRHRKGDPIDIKDPTLNILAGVQPGFLAELLPEQAWSMGFTSRLLMIYAGVGVRQELVFGLSSRENQASLAEYTRYQTALQKDLLSITQLYGEFDFEPEAAAALRTWYDRNLEPIPTHSRLVHYCGRRLMTCFKLSMISSISHRSDLIIGLDDFQRAQDWILDAERRMPDIFRDMAGRGDKQIMDDLHDFLWRIFARTKEGIHESRVITFLSGKVPSEKIVRIIDLCERARLIERDRTSALPLWKPILRDHSRGIE